MPNPTFYVDAANRPLCVQIPGKLGCAVYLKGLVPRFHEPGVEAGKCANCSNPLTPTQAVKFRLERVERFLGKAATRRRLHGDAKAANKADAFRIAVKEKRISLQRRAFTRLDKQSLINQYRNYVLSGSKPALTMDEMLTVSQDLESLL